MDWLAGETGDGSFFNVADGTLEDLIARVQRDTLESAVAICAARAASWNSEIGRPGQVASDCAGYSQEADACAKDILAQLPPEPKEKP